MTKYSVLKYIFLALFNSALIYAIPLTYSYESWTLLAILFFILILVNFTYLKVKPTPLKWITPGIIFMSIFVIYPAIYNIYVSTTNWSTGHVLTKQQALDVLLNKTYTPDDQKGIEFDLYIMQDNESYFYFLADLDNENQLFGKATQEADSVNFGKHEPSILSNGSFTLPSDLKLLSGKEQIDNSNLLQELYLYLADGSRIQLYTISVFGNSSGRLLSSNQRYIYDDVSDVLYDNALNKSCITDKDSFICGESVVEPGWRVYVGLDNYKKLFTNERLRSPLKLVTIWTFQFAFFTVLLAFSLGLLLSLVLNDSRIKFQKIYRSIYLLPYAIPGFVTILVWKGLLNPDYGTINELLIPIYETFNIEPIKWFQTKDSSRAAVLLVNTWLGFPYMMLITTGALQSIPKELGEASRVDGATGFQTFFKVTLPLLMVSISPLLIGAFAYNFNNFTLIYLLTDGGPPVIGSEAPVGWTDILISFTFKLAISGGRGSQFGLASAVTFLVFTLVLIISAVSFQYTKRLEKVYGNL